MLWSKVKNVILVVLALTNVFLLLLVLGEAVEEGSLETEALENARLFLQGHGITVESSELPRELGIFSGQILWSRENEGEYGENLLGELTEESLGGEIVRYYNENGELRFHGNGEFYGSFTQDYLPLSDKKLQEQGEELLKLLGYEGILLHADEILTTGKGEMTFLQTYEGVPLLDCETTFRYENYALVEITQGKRMEGEYLLWQEEYYPLPTALMQFYQGLLLLELDCKNILSIDPCYLVSTPLSAPALLSPAWLFSTDQGDFVLDATTGLLEVYM